MIMDFSKPLKQLSAKTIAAIKRIEYMIWRTRAYKRFFLDDFGNLKTEAIPFLKWFRHFCHADRCVYKAKVDGTIDPYATHVAAGRQEVYQEFVRLLGLDERALNAQIQALRDQDYNP